MSRWFGIYFPIDWLKIWAHQKSHQGLLSLLFIYFFSHHWAFGLIFSILLFSLIFHMHIQKRSVAAEICTDIIKHPTEPIEQKTHKCWRRFMNKRVRDRAYIPTVHGIFKIFFYLLNICIFHVRTCSKLYNTWCTHNPSVYCCTTVSFSCRNSCTILE